MLELTLLVALFGAGVAVGYGWRARISHVRRQRARRGW
jgi:hypothetical protein